MLNSKANNTKLIMETWRRFLSENTDEELTSSELDSFISSMAKNIKINDRGLDPTRFSLNILGIVFIALGLSIPSILAERLDQETSREEINQVVRLIENGEILCTDPGAPDKMRDLAERNAIRIGQGKNKGKIIGYLTTKEAQGVLESFENCCQE
tara:strand:+ start:445 stop:909 length:465 start_codon:yes stop_codon:yes gene_type:complete